jgi:hypothetical protein
MVPRQIFKLADFSRMAGQTQAQNKKTQKKQALLATNKQPPEPVLFRLTALTHRFKQADSGGHRYV